MVASKLFLLALPLCHAIPSSTFAPPRDYTPDNSNDIWKEDSRPSSGLRQTIQDTLKSIWPSHRRPSPHSSGHATPHGVPCRGQQGQSAARYSDQLVLRFYTSTQDDLAAITDASDTLFLDIWDQSEDWLDIRLRYDDVSSLLGLLPERLRSSHTPLMTGTELSRAVYNSYPSSSSPFEASYNHRTTSHADRIMRRPNSDVFFDDYRSLSVITSWMRLLQSIFSSHVRTITIGQSYEGRDIPALRVGVHPTNNDVSPERRKTILITAGSHAREWVSTSTVNYIAYNLITSYGRRKTITSLLEQFDFVFVPTINPDGYAYTWTTDRLWRKNRQPTSLRFCHGFDLDRTWEFKWDGNMTGSSDNPCSEGYAGGEPFQAIESRALAEWAKNETENNNVEFVGLLDLHSYSQQILYPFSYSCDELPPNFEDLAEMAQGLAKAIRSKDHENYRVFSACSAAEPAGGSLLDWFYHELHVRHAFQVKLRDKGSYGFLLPREEIVPTGTEMVRAVEYLGRQLGSKYGGKSIDALWEEEEAADSSAIAPVADLLSGLQKSLKSIL